MGAWEAEPWGNDDAADWFSDAFEGIDIDIKVDKALEYFYDNYDEVRAAAFLLDVLGEPYVWPGDLERYEGHVQKALKILRAMIDEDSDDEDMDFLELWDDDPEVISSVKSQIVNLEKRLA